eukprot:403358833
MIGKINNSSYYQTNWIFQVQPRGQSLTDSIAKNKISQQDLTENDNTGLITARKQLYQKQNLVSIGKSASILNTANNNVYFKNPNLDEKALKQNQVINSSLYKSKEFTVQNDNQLSSQISSISYNGMGNAYEFNNQKGASNGAQLSSLVNLKNSRSPQTIKLKSNMHQQKGHMHYGLSNLVTKSNKYGSKSGHLFSYTEIRDQKLGINFTNNMRNGSVKIGNQVFNIKQLRNLDEEEISSALLEYLSRERPSVFRNSGLDIKNNQLNTKQSEEMFNLFVGNRNKNKQFQLNTQIQNNNDACQDQSQIKVQDQEISSNGQDQTQNNLGSIVAQKNKYQSENNNSLPVLKQRQYTASDKGALNDRLKDQFQQQMSTTATTNVSAYTHSMTTNNSALNEVRASYSITKFNQVKNSISSISNSIATIKQRDSLNNSQINEVDCYSGTQNNNRDISRQKQMNYLKQKTDRLASSQINDRANKRVFIERNNTIQETVTEESKLENRPVDQSQIMQNQQQIQIARPMKRIQNPYEEQQKEYERIQQQRNEARVKYNQLSQNIQSKQLPYKFIIKEGNNHWIIRRILSTRLTNQDTIQVQWEETSNYDSLFNFKWQPFSSGLKYDFLSKYGLKQMVNHIQGHENLTTKDLIFSNMKQYCDKVNLNVFDFLPLTFILDFKSDQLYEQLDIFKGVFRIIEQNIHLSTNELTTKIQNLQAQYDRKAYKSQNCFKLLQSSHDYKNLWLLKPTGLNRGRGIHIFKSLDELKQILNDFYDVKLSSQQSPIKEQQKKIQNAQVDIHLEEQDGNQNSKQVIEKFKSYGFVVQKYIEKPLLFKNRKFDLRVWALINYDMKCYVFKECYVRTSCEDYNLQEENLDKIYVHLTNNAIQKNSDNYGKFEDGNQISLKELAVTIISYGLMIIQDNLSEQLQNKQGLSGDEIKLMLEDQYKSLILHSLKAVKNKLKFQKHTFELVGYDFIVDEDLQSYIIEVNTNPCIEESSGLLKMLLPRMIDDMFKLTIDTIFPINSQQQQQQQAIPSQYKVENYDDNVNMFEYLYSFI